MWPELQLREEFGFSHRGWQGQKLAFPDSLSPVEALAGRNGPFCSSASPFCLGCFFCCPHSHPVFVKWDRGKVLSFRVSAKVTKNHGKGVLTPCLCSHVAGALCADSAKEKAYRPCATLVGAPTVWRKVAGKELHYQLMVVKSERNKGDCCLRLAREGP